ncbi:MAG: UTP--glucose-1-phosphate uridylyltransferase [Buchananella hordeovulneris]|nr:UTP--glucose-1-phosphate uridylyltransferase [Buchananella hordeovulneris]
MTSQLHFAKSRVTHAIVPVAGRGTRFLPATRAVPKEMLPVVDRPAIEYVLREAGRSGIKDAILVTGRGKHSIEDHFDTTGDAPVTAPVEVQGRLSGREFSSEGLPRLHSVRQGDPLGLGHAVLQGRHHVGHNPFAVLLGDDLMDEDEVILREMIRVREELGGSVLCLMPVTREEISLYGSASVVEVEDAPEGLEGRVMRVTGLVEKPKAGEAPSLLASVGRFVLDPAVFDVLETLPPGHGGEIQLTDAIAKLIDVPAEQGGGVHGVIFTGLRYDTGDKLGFVKATVQLAARRGDIGPDFVAWLREFVPALPAGDGVDDVAAGAPQGGAPGAQVTG